MQRQQHLRRRLNLTKTDGVLDAAGERPQFSCQVTRTTISLRLAPTTRRHDDGTGPAADGEADGATKDDDEDGGVLTLTALPSTTVSTVEPSPPQVSFQF